MKKHSKGFTLIELIVVIAILGILVAIAVPKMGGSRKTAAINAHNANVRELQSAAMMYIADKGNPPSVVNWTKDSKDGEKGWGPYLQEWPTPPNGTGKPEVDGQSYTVKIDTDGTVTVTPTMIPTTTTTTP